MTVANHPTDMLDNPDGRDYHYRFHANDEEAWKRLRHARWKNRMYELYPSDMEHLRVKLSHVTVKTYDHMGHIKGMKKYAKSPKWEKVPYSRGKKEMKNANGGGTKIRAEEYTGEKWGTVNVEFHIDATPSEVKDAFENGVNEDEIDREIADSMHWAVEDRIDELRQERYEFQEQCDHDHVVKNSSVGSFAYCEDCQKGWHDEMEFQNDYLNDELTLVGSV